MKKILCSNIRGIHVMTQYLMQLSIDVSRQSTFADSIPSCYLEIELNPTTEYVFLCQLSIKYRSWPLMHRYFPYIFPKCISESSLKTLSLVVTLKSSLMTGLLCRGVWFPAIAYVTCTGKGVKIYSTNQWSRFTCYNYFICWLEVLTLWDQETMTSQFSLYSPTPVFNATG